MLNEDKEHRKTPLIASGATRKQTGLVQAAKTACKGGAQTYRDDERMVAQQNKAKHKRHQERVMEIY